LASLAMEAPMRRTTSRQLDNYTTALAGMEGTVDTLVGGLGGAVGGLVEKQTARLETALKIIIALSAVSAACGVVGLLRGR